MVYKLSDIQGAVQQTAEAIAAALKIEVEFADNNLIRVAGTGKYKSQSGCEMNGGYVYSHVLKTGKPVVIDNTGAHELCKPCIYHGNCPEYAEVALPIRVEDKIIGVIGLISFDEEQAKRLKDNKESFLMFLEKMADLVVAKVVEDHQNRQKELLADQLLTVLNLLHSGILVVNDEKKVTQYNTLGEKMLDINPGEEIELSQLLVDKEIWKSMEAGKTFYGHIKARRVSNQLYCEAVPIKKNGIMEGLVITLKDMQQIKRLVNDTTLSEVETSFSNIIGNSAKMRELKQMALRVAPSNSTLLIQGESGTGKELLARAIHQNSKRENNVFVALNCGAIPENLLESELFGYEEGAFTGARRGGKIGKFELAHNGTIFLDEIGDMPLHLQVKLLRVLQERRVERVGSSRSVPINVRVIAATNRDLERLVERGEFREDLYYRLNVIPLTIPPLRDRKDDIPTLVDYYLQHYCDLTDKKVKKVTSEAGRILNDYSWPGNVRELANVVEYAVTMASNEYITPEMLPNRVKDEKRLNQPEQSLDLKVLEREAITKALEMASANGHKDDAAKLLGISRATLYRKIKTYNIIENVNFK